MIHDCFTFAGEFDVLELRLETLADVVDRFVVAEGTRSFAGQPREVSQLHARVPARFRDRIVHLVVDELEAAPQSAWHNEFRQRNALARGILDAHPDDLLVLSDVDEIPHPDSVRRFRPGRYLSAVLHQRVFYYALNNELVVSGDPWELPCKAARVTTVRHFHRFYRTMQNLRRFGSESRLAITARRIDALLLNRVTTQHLVPGGWHFTYLMTPAAIAQKIASFSHQEYNQGRYTDLEHLARCVQSRTDPFGRERHFRVVDTQADLPLPIQREPDRFRTWLVPDPASATAVAGVGRA
jgi:beta-1,4-mannosyl-glycoprotein beta-1,4-N-acetylglucosaminyltransferase